MDGLKTLLDRRAKKAQEVSQVKTTDWQFLALEIVKYMSDGQVKKSGIFGCCRKDPHSAKIAFLDCQELGKPFSNYFFKVFHEIRKK
jgi:hypothetical protein